MIDLFIGIDPGMSGGIAWYCHGEMHCTKMPDTEADLWELLGWTLPELSTNSFCFIENVHTMPNDGKVSAGKFMYNKGLLHGFLIASGIPFEKVTPSKWQNAFSLAGVKDESKTDKKNRHKQKAQELFPSIPRITHAVADALLICEYCRRIKVTQ